MQRQLDREVGADLGDDLGREQRVAAEREEVVVDADSLDPEHVAQIAATASSIGVRGAT